MSQPDPQPAHQVNQSQQSGGVNLGAYNQIKQLEIGDVFTGDKIVVQKLELIIYTGGARPSNAEMRADLLRAYRSEVAARYAVWRRRYATLPMVARPMITAQPARGLYEREDLTFVALRQAFPLARRPAGRSISPGMSGSGAPATTRPTPTQPIRWRKTLQLVILSCRCEDMPTTVVVQMVAAGRAPWIVPSSGSTPSVFGWWCPLGALICLDFWLLRSVFCCPGFCPV